MDKEELEKNIRRIIKEQSTFETGNWDIKGRQERASKALADLISAISEVKDVVDDSVGRIVEIMDNADELSDDGKQFLFDMVFLLLTSVLKKTARGEEFAVIASFQTEAMATHKDNMDSVDKRMGSAFSHMHAVLDDASDALRIRIQDYISAKLMDIGEILRRYQASKEED